MIDNRQQTTGSHSSQSSCESSDTAVSVNYYGTWSEMWLMTCVSVVCFPLVSVHFICLTVMFNQVERVILQRSVLSEQFNLAGGVILQCCTSQKNCALWVGWFCLPISALLLQAVLPILMSLSHLKTVSSVAIDARLPYGATDKSACRGRWTQVTITTSRTKTHRSTSSLAKRQS